MIESLVQLVMMALQEIAGFDVHHCATGADAVKAVSQFKPQLMLFDVMLPDMDGPQTLAKFASFIRTTKRPSSS